MFVPSQETIYQTKLEVGVQMDARKGKFSQIFRLVYLLQKLFELLVAEIYLVQAKLFQVWFLDERKQNVLVESSILHIA